MSGSDVGTASSTAMAELSTIDMGLEVVTVPVSDVDRAKRFYQSLGWRLDIDLVVSDDARTVQFTPPHSQCSIQIGKGRTTAEHHGSFEAVAPPHDWWDWYAAYMDAREGGKTPQEASALAGRYMAEVKNVVVSGG